MQRLLLAFIALTFVACGPPIATTDVTGSVDGVSFSSASAIYGKESAQNVFDSGRVYVLISDASSACSSLASTGLLTRSGVSGAQGQRLPSLYVSLGDPASTWRRSASTNDGLTANLDPGGSTASPATLTAISSGSVTLERYDDPSDRNARASGRFDLTFAGGTLSGTFFATPCSALSPGCSAGGASLAVPALLALLRALGRRRR